LPPEELSEKVVEEINRRRVPARTRDAINAAEGNESALRRMRRREELE
jgi:phage-related protein